MATVHANPHVASSEYLACQRRLEQCLRALQTCGWEQRLQPLATHMIEKRLVRARSHAGAPLRHLDLEVLREAVGRLLAQAWENGSLICQLMIDGADPAEVARERGVSRPVLVEILRDAVDELALTYKDIARSPGGRGPFHP